MDYFLLWSKLAQNGSILCRRSAKHIFVQASVIFPRVHVARNIRRFDRNPFDLIAMRREQRAQTALGVERQQLIPIRQIDQDGMPAASFVLGLDDAGSSSPFVDKNLDRGRRHGRMIDQSDDYCAGAGIYLFDPPGNRLTHLAIRIGIDCERKVEGF